MNSLTIQASSHTYEVALEKGLRKTFADLLEKKYESVLVITDDQVAGLYLDEVTHALSSIKHVETAVVPRGEASKSMEHYGKLLDVCVEARLDRQSLIIALGGGMIGDLAGFVASTYLRGIDYIQMPTTILAHDSSVGGKVAVNHPKGKNLIGSFYSPKRVIYDIDMLKTLPDSEIRSGYGEVIKHAFLSDADWAGRLLHQSLKHLSGGQLKEDLAKGIQVKASIVEQDEREAGVRKHLNLGHTLAHAIESELGYGKVTHGEAVAIGLAFAFHLSSLKTGVHLPIKDYINWMKVNDYPLTVLKDCSPERLVERMKWDKKTVHQNIHYVLLEKIGSPCVMKIDDQELLHELKHWMSEVNG